MEQSQCSMTTARSPGRGEGEGRLMRQVDSHLAQQSAQALVRQIPTGCREKQRSASCSTKANFIS